MTKEISSNSPDAMELLRRVYAGFQIGLTKNFNNQNEIHTFEQAAIKEFHGEVKRLYDDFTATPPVIDIKDVQNRLIAIFTALPYTPDAQEFIDKILDWEALLVSFYKLMHVEIMRPLAPYSLPPDQW